MNDETARPQLMPVIDTSEFAQLLDSDRFAQVQRVAKLFSESDLVPEIFQGKIANCAVALQMAFRMRVDPMMLMQNMYIIKGRPGIEAKLAIALMNSRGPFKGPLQWKQDGADDSRLWTCYAIHERTQQTCEATVTWAMVKAEGWDKPRGKGEFQQPSKWTTIPDIMGRYRSAMILGRLYCPEVLLGLPSQDELDDSEITVEGSHVIEARPEIMMPRAKPAAAVDAETAPPAAIDPLAPRSAGPVMFNMTTGEIEIPGTPPAQEPQGAAQTPAADPTPTGAPSSAPEAAPRPVAIAGGAGPTGAAPNDPMTRPASDAQRRAVMTTGKNKGLTPEQIESIVVDATGFTVASLPMGMVNKALGALANHNANF